MKTAHCALVFAGLLLVCGCTAFHGDAKPRDAED